MIRDRKLVLNYIFLGCLIILVLNDHCFKQQYSNWLTGKLSDLVGLIILPLLLTYLIPQLKTKSIWISALFFIFWKSPFSQSLIDFYNQFSIIKITRVVDYLDLIAFIILPIPYLLIKNINSFKRIQIVKINPIFIILPCLVALISTSPPKNYYYKVTSNGNFQCFDCSIKVKMSQSEIIEKLEQNNIKFDTIIINNYLKSSEKDLVKRYSINQLVLKGDTLKNVEITMHSLTRNKTKIYLNGAQLDNIESATEIDEKIKEKYKKMLFDELKKTF